MWYSQQQLEKMLGKEKSDAVFTVLWMLQKPKTSKYWNIKVWWVDSKKEYNRLQELHYLEKSWKIRHLKTQVPFLLQESFEWNGKKEREIKYIVDFVYLKEWEDKLTVEDSKGFRNDVYKIKRKMFLCRYGKTHHFIES